MPSFTSSAPSSGWTPGRIGRTIGYAVVAIILLNIIFGSWEKVDATDAGIRLRWGAVAGEALPPGLYFTVPFMDEIVKLDTRVQKTEVGASAASRDLQVVTAKIAVSYQLDNRRIISVYQDFKNEYAPRIIDPAIQESIKAATAKYSAEELVTKRESVRDAAKESLKVKLEPHGIQLVEFNIVDFDFSAGFNKAIEDKVTQEQIANTEQNKLKTIQFQADQRVATAEGEKKAAIATAQGEAEAIRIKSEALKSNPQFLDLERINMQVEWAKRWTGNVPQTVMGDTPVVPFMNFTPGK